VIKSPRGTRDILPSEWTGWERLLRCAEQVAERAGYQRIETPTFEFASLFRHATGEHTDVNREMYVFTDRGGDELTLRPEGTAPVFRAYSEHGMRVLPQPVKLYYLGSMFRYERPQSGRSREHHQFGCEAIGSEDPLLDASMIDLQRRFYASSGITATTIHINSIGDSACRPGYVRELVAYLHRNADRLCGDCRERIERNPLRVLDCKNPACQSVLNEAPKSLDYLCDECREHWERVSAGLRALEIRVEVDARLVRGLDYYTRTVWEFHPPGVQGSQSVLGGGGRYDALAAAIGAPEVPGVGFSTGLERVLLNLPARPETSVAATDVYVAHLGDEAALQALRLAHILLESQLRVQMTFGSRSLKTQLRYAGAAGAALAVLIGEDEIRDGVVTVRDLRTRDQRRVDLAGATREIITQLHQRGSNAP